MNLPDEVRGAPHLAVVTGAAGGLHAALAADLDRQGWATIRIDVRPPECDPSISYVHPIYHMAETTKGADVEEWRQRLVAEVPVGRACLPSDVAQVVTFLASEGAQFLTGHALNVVGGREVH